MEESTAHSVSSSNLFKISVDPQKLLLLHEASWAPWLSPGDTIRPAVSLGTLSGGPRFVAVALTGIPDKRRLAVTGDGVL